MESESGRYDIIIIEGEGAKSLCTSSRIFHKLSKRCERTSWIIGLKTLEENDFETEVEGEATLRIYTPSCKTLGGSAELAVDPAKFCLTHRQMRAEGIFVI